MAKKSSVLNSKGEKRCSRCGKYKPLNEFNKRTNRSIGVYPRCRECNKKRVLNYQRSHRGIWRLLKSRKDICDFNTFEKWYKEQEKECFYCGINLKDWENVADTKKRMALRMTVDRLNNNNGYFIGNMVLACQVCNRTRNDFFSVDEMKEIAKRFIRPKLLNGRE